MQPRVDLISLGVHSVDASRRFYVDGLGWPVQREVRGEVLFIQATHGRLVSLWDPGQRQAAAATDPPSASPALRRIAHSRRSAEVHPGLAAAGSAGADWAGG